MAFIHISQFNPMTNEGGVAIFARNLADAVPDLKFLYHGEINRPWESVERINRKYLEDGAINAEDVVIADGYYGAGLSGKVDKLIVVCHSTYAGWLRDNLVWPTGDRGASLAWLAMAAEAQEPVYRSADAVVSVCGSAWNELWRFYRVDSRTIFNGVDTSVFVPGDDLPNDEIVSVAGADVNKGADIVTSLHVRHDKKINELGFDGLKQDRWLKHGIAVFPSRHEGGSFAQLEAMATNRKIVAAKTGFLDVDVPDRYFWGTRDIYHGTFNRLIDKAIDSPGRNPREWLIGYADIDVFRRTWRKYLGIEEENDG